MTRPALEQFSIGVGEHKGGVQYDAVSREMQSYQSIRSQYQDSRTTDSVLPKVKLSDESVKLDDETARKEAVDNARKEFPSLMKKAGVQGEYDGLNHDDLVRLKKMTDLSAKERAAVDYMLTNYDKLNTRRMFESIGPITNAPQIRDWAEIFQRRRITPDSLLRNSPGTSVIREEVQQTDPRDADRLMRDGRGKSDGPRRPRDGSPDDIVVKENDGWERIAEKSLRNHGVRNYDRKTLYEEIERLHKLNPDKIKMVHPGDRIRTR